jgi:hypothetical protein
MSDFFENVDQFIPERYILTEHGTKPGVDASDFRASLAFGAGRVRDHQSSPRNVVNL